MIRVLITRALHQASSLREEFEQAGAIVFECPTIAIADPESWEPADVSIRKLDQYDWVLFASSNAVERFIKRVSTLSSAASLGTAYATILKNTKLATIGPATRAALTAFGLESSYTPERFIAESFVAGFPGYPNLQGQKFLWPRTNIGRDLIKTELSKVGAEVNVIEVYRTVLPPDSDAAAALLRRTLTENRIDAITLASSQSVRNFVQLLRLAANETTGESGGEIGVKKHSSTDWLQLIAGAKLVAIGDATAKTIHSNFGRCDAVAEEQSRHGLVKAVLDSVGGESGTID